jgi:hypothetical protein
VKRSYADRVLAFEPTAGGGVTLELWSDDELVPSDSVTVEFWSVQGELLRKQVERPRGRGLKHLVEWPRGQWPAGVVVYAFGAGAHARLRDADGLLGEHVAPTTVRLDPDPGFPDHWIASATAPITSVKLSAGPDAQFSDNWFPLVPGHPVRVKLTRGLRSTGQVPNIGVFKR